MRDSHLWLSVGTRSTQSNFTSVERLSCCLCMLYCYMLANIMFYGVESQKSDDQQLDLGFRTISWTQIRIGAAAAALLCWFSLPRTRVIGQIVHNILIC